MGDVLIREVPDDVLEMIDLRAKRKGLSRNTYLQELVTRAACGDHPATAGDLRKLQLTLQDLADPEVMKQAWDLPSTDSSGQTPGV